MAFVISIIPTTAITTNAITSDILMISDFFIAVSSSESVKKEARLCKASFSYKGRYTKEYRGSSTTPGM